MDRGFRRGFTAAEKAELWDRWQRGESLKAIGRAFGKPSSSIYFQVAPHGGIRPAARRRSRLALTLSEREEISRGITAHQSARSIARLLGRSPSTVSREIARNGDYDPRMAATTGRPVKVAVGVTPRLRSYFFAPLMLAFAGSSVFGGDCLTANLSTRVRLGVHIHIQLPGRKLHRLFRCQYGLSRQWAISWTALLRKPYDDRPLVALRSGSVKMGHCRRSR